MILMTSTLQFRPAGDADRAAVARLAALDDAEPVSGEVVMAFADGHAVAAMSTADGRVVADPFHHTAEAVELMRHYAGGRSRSSRGRLRFTGLHRLATG
jgi:prepilin-type processing-associated H-X9-DG protein